MIGKLSSLPEGVQGCIDQPAQENEDQLVQTIDACDGLWDSIKKEIVHIFESHDDSLKSVEGIPTQHGVLLPVEEKEQ
jgi:hypothetical protein